MISLITPSEINWTNITGVSEGTTNIVTMPYSTTISAGVSSVTGSGALYYVINGGSPITYSTPFVVTAGQTLQWGAMTKSGLSGIVAISGNGVQIDTFSVFLS